MERKEIPDRRTGVITEKAGYRGRDRHERKKTEEKMSSAEGKIPVFYP